MKWTCTCVSTTNCICSGSTPFTFGLALNASPVWAPDGARIIFRTNRTGGLTEFYAKSAGGGGTEQPVLLQTAARASGVLSVIMLLWDWSPDGQHLIFSTTASSDRDLWLLPLTGDQKPVSFLSAPGDQMHGTFSQDGRLVAYSSSESGPFEVHGQTFPLTDRQWIVSTTGGYEPRWRADGREMYYLSLDRKLMAVTVDPGPSFGTPTALFQARVAGGVSSQRTHYVPAATGSDSSSTRQPATLRSFPSPWCSTGKPRSERAKGDEHRSRSGCSTLDGRTEEVNGTLAAGARLGAYEILALVGAGGTGEVYKGRDTRLDRIVAIKILPEGLAADPQFRERFDREARTLSQFTHPNICTLYDVGEAPVREPSAGSHQRSAISHGTVQFLVMELLDGETLEDRCARASAKGSGLPLDEALRIAIQMADALAAAHRQGIVHRDLKPGNIFLARNRGASGPPIAKLLDFGLARTAPALTVNTATMMPTTLPHAMTAQGTILGTFQYMAPEQVRAARRTRAPTSSRSAACSTR